MATAKAAVDAAPEQLEAPTGPTYAASVSNIAYDKNVTQVTGALCTGMGYAPNVDPASTTVTQYMGGNTLTIGYHLPS